jgi:8-oxo-dGTP pyrophosphatase MutT (NUDIX family)
VSLPAAPGTGRRAAVRLVCLDALDRVLLLEAVDPTDPAQGPWWELPGGGVEHGESPLEAALRELREETGLTVPPRAVEAPRWRRSATWRFMGRRVVQDEQVCVVRLDQVGPPVQWTGGTPAELATYRDARWWTAEGLAAARARFYPGRLPELLPRLLAGDVIDEPFERWN